MKAEGHEFTHLFYQVKAELSGLHSAMYYFGLGDGMMSMVNARAMEPLEGLEIAQAQALLDEPSPLSRRRINRFYTLFGLALGTCVGKTGFWLWRLLSPTFTLQQSWWYETMQTFLLFLLAGLLIYAVIRTDVLVNLENHVLELLSDGAKARQEGPENETGTGT